MGYKNIYFQFFIINPKLIYFEIIIFLIEL